MKLIKEKFAVESDKSDRVYSVVVYADDSMGCSCPSWIFQKGERKDCKHIVKLRSKLVGVAI